MEINYVVSDSIEKNCCAKALILCIVSVPLPPVMVLQVTVRFHTDVPYPEICNLLTFIKNDRVNYVRTGPSYS